MSETTISLLWPPGISPRAGENVGLWGKHSAQDLSIDEIAGALSPESRYVSEFKTILLTLCPNPHVIQYRQAVLEDCLHSHRLRTGLDDLLPALTEIKWLNTTPDQEESVLFQTIQRMRELDLYVQCVKGLSSLLTEVGPELQSEALCHLRQRLIELENDPAFYSLSQKLPEWRAGVAYMQSATIGVNLDAKLRPTQVALLSLDDKPYTQSTLLSRLLGNRDENRDVMLIQDVPWMGHLFQDLERLLKSAYGPVTKALTYYAQLSSGLLVSLASEAVFYLSAIRLIEKMRAAGLPMCRPEVAPVEERVCQIAALYNLRLALAQDDKASSDIVTNDVRFDEDGRILILTGPNQGGKTTYTQAIGLIQVLFQAGWYVPGRQGRISPVDGIYTHFPLEEKPYLDTGRLGEEAQRLCDIFRQVTPYSLVLLNESLSSTSPGESLYLAQDIVRGLRLFGVRAIFATHLHELAEKTEMVNADTPGDSKAISMVAGTLSHSESARAMEAVKRTYKIVPAPPIGISYAKDIANRFGISFEQLVQMRRERTPTSDTAD